jgi:hypothetical protein
MARRLGTAPLYQYFNQQPTNDWLQTVTERLGLYTSSASPSIAEVPTNQWMLHRDTSSGDLALYVNDNGVLIKATLTPGGGGGDVTGPAIAVDNHVVFFDGASGKIIKDSGLTLAGTNTGDQTITLTGDVTGSGTGPFATTIAQDAVTYDKMQDVSAPSLLLGRGSVGAGDVQEITLGTNLTMTGTTLDATGGSGSGDVVGPASATNNAIALFDGVTGKLIKDGVTTLSGLQPVNANLTALAAYNTNGILTQTAANTFVGRTITGTAAEITVTNGDGVAGNPVISLPAAITMTGKVVTGGFHNSIQQLGILNQHVAGFDMRFEYSSASATANRSLTVDLNNATRGLNMSGNLTVSALADVSGTNTGDETLSSIGSKLDGAAAKNPPVDADVTIILDSAAANAPKKLSWLNIKATLKTYFDTLYQVLDADLTSWAAVTRAAGFDTMVATPTSANVRGWVTDESGTGALLFQSGDLGTPTAGVMTNVTGTAAGLTAGVASTVAIANEATDTTCFPLFGTAASGNLQPKTNANLSFNSNTGVLTSASSVLTTTDINGGTVDGAVIGATSAAAGTFTTLTATGQVVISGAGAGQIVFPATKNASANANTLDDYQEGSFTGTGTGFTTSPTCTINYTIVGNMVTMDITGAGISATSNATTFTITGMPAECFPTNTKAILLRTKNNGAAHIVSVATIANTGVITLFNGPDGAAFTNSGTKACPAASFCYTLT